MVVVPRAERTGPVEWVAWKTSEEGELDCSGEVMAKNRIVRFLALIDSGNS